MPPTIWNAVFRYSTAALSESSRSIKISEDVCKLDVVGCELDARDFEAVELEWSSLFGMLAMPGAAAVAGTNCVPDNDEDDLNRENDRLESDPTRYEPSFELLPLLQVLLLFITLVCFFLAATNRPTARSSSSTARMLTSLFMLLWELRRSNTILYGTLDDRHSL